MKPTDKKDHRSKLIFLNLINGVHVPYVAAAFHASPDEIMKTFDFCLRKIKSHAISHHKPPVLVNTLKQAIVEKVFLSHLAEEIKHWDEDPKFKNIEHKLITPDQFYKKARTL
jgi:hypothetical protein